MKKIPLSRGYIALVDDEDYDRVEAAGPWFAVVGGSSNVYAVHHVPQPEGGRIREAMHRFILTIADAKVEVKHKDGDGLDNRRENLRTKKRTRTKARFPGVYWATHAGRWVAKVCVNGRKLHLGYFDAEEDGARAVAEFRANVGRCNASGETGKTNETTASAVLTTAPAP